MRSYRHPASIRPRFHHALAAGALGVVLARFDAPAGELIRRDGRELHGRIDFATNGLIVTPSNDKPETIAFTDVRQASFATAPSEIASNAWQSADVGEVHLPGAFTSTNGVLTLRGTGWGCWPSEDGLRLAWQPMRGDGQIIARVDRFDDTNGLVFAGVTLREERAPNSRHVTVLVSSANRMQMRARTTNTVDGFFGSEETKASPWLRVSRRGNTFTAFHSSDGADWQLLEQKVIQMKPDALAGVVVATRVNSAIGGAAFDAVAITAGQPGNGSTELPARGVILRDGTVLAGTTISDDGKILSISDGTFRSTTLPAHRVAAVLFRPAPLSLAQPSAEPPRQGLWLLSGDVMEGDLVELNTNRISIESILLGQRKYQLEANQIAFVFARVSEPAPPWILHLRDGSRVGATTIAAGKGALTFAHPLLGKFTVPSAEVVELRTNSDGAH